MTRILFVGQEPETVDFSGPALPPGFSAEKIHAGITIALRQMTERGWDADLCLIRPDKTAVSTLESQLASKPCELPMRIRAVGPCQEALARLQGEIQSVIPGGAMRDARV